MDIADAIFFIGTLIALAGLGYGAWQCFLIAVIYDADNVQADIAASRTARSRGHAETTADFTRY